MYIYICGGTYMYIYICFIHMVDHNKASWVNIVTITCLAYQVFFFFFRFFISPPFNKRTNGISIVGGKSRIIDLDLSSKYMSRIIPTSRETLNVWFSTSHNLFLFTINVASYNSPPLPPLPLFPSKLLNSQMHGEKSPGTRNIFVHSPSLLTLSLSLFFLFFFSFLFIVH